MLDEIMIALSSGNRRRLLLTLHDENGPVELDLTNEVDEVEYHHNHLPHLEKAGFIQYDEDRQEVSRGPKFDKLGPILEAVRNFE